MTVDINDITGFITLATNTGYLLSVLTATESRLSALGVTNTQMGQTVGPVTSYRTPTQLDYVRLAAGNVFFVQSSSGSAADDTSHGGVPSYPYATLAYALTKVTASNGDLIVVLPGHAETISAAGTITCSVAGVSIVGIGQGSLKPRFTWSAVASTWLVTAANVSITNIDCVTSVDEMVSLFVVSAAFCTLDGVNFYETTSAQAIQFLLTTAAGDDLEIKNCRHYQNTAAAATQAWIKLIGSDRFYIHDNVFALTLKDSATSAVINCATTACHDGVIARNVVRMTGYSSALLSTFLDSASSRIMVANNQIATDAAANTTINDCPSGWSFNTLGTNAVDKSGILDPVVDT